MYLTQLDPAFLAVESESTPSLDLFFSATKALDSRITFVRASVGTFINSSGLIESASSGTARFTHEPITLRSLGLLVEEPRTNLLLRSEEIGTSPWTASGSSISANFATSPDGTSNADKLVENTALDDHQVYQSATIVSGTTYSLSLYVKPAGRSWFGMGIIGLGVTGTVFFDVANGTVGNVKAGVTASIQNAGNGWYRCIVVGAATATSFTLYASARTSNGSGTYTGDGSSGLLFWGAQLEAGAFVTSYIKTTSATVERAADSVTMTGTNFSSWFNASEGTLFADYVSTGTTASKFFQVAALDGGSNNSGIGLVDTFNRAANVFIPSFSIQASFTTTLPTSQQSAALAYKANDFAASFNGGTVQTDGSGSLPTLAILYIGNGPVAGQQAAGTISRIRYYRRRINNAGLQSMTT
jgi:hypothetical protein